MASAAEGEATATAHATANAATHATTNATANATLAETDDKGLPRKRKLTSDASLPSRVTVTGAGAQWLNQTYTRQESSRVKEYLGKEWAGWSLEHKGTHVYIASEPSDKGPGSLPYIWHDWKHRQWKLATIGFETSHYLSRFPAGGKFPDDLRSWRSGPTPRKEDPFFPDSLRHTVGNIKIAAVEGNKGISEQTVKSTIAWFDCGHAFSEIPPGPKLASTVAQHFLKQGYIIMRAADLNTTQPARRAYRAANIAIRDALEAGQGTGLDRLRDYSISDSHQAWSAFANLLLPDSSLWGLLHQFTDRHLQRPGRCQLAMIFPEGRPDDGAYAEYADSRPHLDYHIDGRGKIPNGFTLLVGIALNDQAAHCQSWGGLTVFPGSHLRSDLHRAYSSQKLGEVQKRMDLGEGCQLHLKQGDVVIAHSLLAHRSSENWSEAMRCMAYFRLRPEWCTAGWEDGLLDDPLSNVPGVVLRARTGEVDQE